MTLILDFIATGTYFLSFVHFQSGKESAKIFYYTVYNNHFLKWTIRRPITIKTGFKISLRQI